MLLPDRKANRNSLRVLWVLPLCLSYAALSYGYFTVLWTPLVGSALIGLFAWMAWRSEWRSWIGIRCTLREALPCLMLFIACLFGSVILVQRVASSADLVVAPMGLRDFARGQSLLTLGQTLNEEIVLGAILLRWTAKRLKDRRLMTISILVAAGFALLHFAFYSCRSEESFHYGILTWPTLLAVFGAGVLRNNLILSSGHIGFSWAVHLAFNLALFAGHHAASGAYLTEPELFASVLGAWPTVVVTWLAVSVSFWLGREPLLTKPGAFHWCLR